MLPRSPSDSDEDDDRVDGRRLRGKKTRGAIVQALLELIEEGNPEPPAREIAERAGIAIRSIRQHFETREELLLAVAELHAERLGAARESIEESGSLEDRLERFLQTRSRELEASSPMRLAASIAEPYSETVVRAVRATAKARRRDVAHVFEKELAKIGAADRKIVIDALDAATSGRTWDGMRRDAGLGLGAARDAMKMTIESILGLRK
jgi:AcrR family transcriptional regulator